MAAKPGSLPRWANVGGDIVVPNSGKMDIGWVDNEQPANEFDNWFKNLVYQWCSYLSDGALTGDFTISGDLAVGDDLTVTGDFSAATLTTAEGGVHHGDVTVELPFMFASGELGGAYSTNSPALTGVVDNTSGSYVVASTEPPRAFCIKLPLKNGDRLKSIRVKAFDNVGGAITVSVVKQSMSTVVAPPGSVTVLGSTASANSANFQDIVVTVTELSAGQPTSYMANIYTTSNTAHYVYAVWMTYDRP